MVQEELTANKNGLAVFKFNDITTFKVIVMNADLEAVKAMESETDDNTETIQKQHRNDTETIQKQRRNDTEKLSKSEQKILESISANPSITSDDLSKIVGITAVNIRVNISKLKAKGLLERKGGDKGGYWEVKQ